MSYTTKPEPSLDQLTNVSITDVSNNDILSYNNGIWENKTELVTGDITCNDLQVLGTCNVDGEFSTDGLTKLFNDRYIFGADAEFEGNFIVDTAQNTLYVDTINHRVGINKIPTEDLDVDGNIQINTNGTEKITFYDNGHDHEHGKLLFTTDGTDGAEFEIHTLTDGGSVTQKLTINNVGAIGLGATPSYGTAGSILTSNGSSSPPTWNEPYRMRVYKNTIQTIPDNVGTKIVDWLVDTDVSTTQGSNDYNTTTSIWSPSIAGVYHISAQVYISPASGAEVLRAVFRLYDTLGNIVRDSDYTSDPSDEGVYQMTISFNDMVYTDATVGYELRITIDRKFGGTTRLIDGTIRSWFSAYRIG